MSCASTWLERMLFQIDKSILGAISPTRTTQTAVTQLPDRAPSPAPRVTETIRILVGLTLRKNLSNSRVVRTTSAI